jgi:hypothetical protein
VKAFIKALYGKVYAPVVNRKMVQLNAKSVKQFHPALRTWERYLRRVGDIAHSALFEIAPHSQMAEEQCPLIEVAERGAKVTVVGPSLIRGHEGITRKIQLLRSDRDELHHGGGGLTAPDGNQGQRGLSRSSSLRQEAEAPFRLSCRRRTHLRGRPRGTTAEMERMRESIGGGTGVQNT